MDLAKPSNDLALDSDSSNKRGASLTTHNQWDQRQCQYSLFELDHHACELHGVEQNAHHAHASFDGDVDRQQKTPKNPDHDVKVMDHDFGW